MQDKCIDLISLPEFAFAGDVTVICFSVGVTSSRDVIHLPLWRRMNDHSAALFVHSEMNPSAFCHFFSLTLRFSLVLYMRLSIHPHPFFKHTHTQEQKKKTASLTCADCKMQTAC